MPLVTQEAAFPFPAGHGDAGGRDEREIADLPVQTQRGPPAGGCGSAGLGVDVHSGMLEKRDTRPVGIRTSDTNFLQETGSCPSSEVMSEFKVQLS